MNPKLNINKETEKKIFKYSGITALISLFIFIILLLIPRQYTQIIPSEIIVIFLFSTFTFGLIYIGQFIFNIQKTGMEILTTKDERTIKIRNHAIFYSVITTGISIILLKYLIVPFITNITLNQFIGLIINIFIISSIIFYYYLNKKGEKI